MLLFLYYIAKSLKIIIYNQIITLLLSRIILAFKNYDKNIFINEIIRVILN
jgi:hypothetical protein